MLMGIFLKLGGPLNCNSEKVLYLLKFNACGEGPYVGKRKTNFRKSKVELSEKKTEKCPRNVFMIVII